MKEPSLWDEYNFTSVEKELLASCLLDVDLRSACLLALQHME